jgi:undecaprenyldiphospho-muramoylpentapeptide beta-N-acetylglucosaminyltransferase
VTRRGERAFAVVAGGGTAGHVSPALAIAEALVARGHDRSSIHYVGSEHGIEVRLVPPTGFPHTFLPGRGIRRRLTPRNVGAVFGLGVAVLRALRLVGRLRPRVVIVVGAYASVACAVAAWVRGIPVIVAEQNLVPGAANRLVGRFAKASAVSFEGTPLPRAVVTGNPVRPEVLAVDRDRDGARARRELEVGEGRHAVLAMGGSLGALRVNHAVVDAARRWAHRDDLHIRHIVGERDWDEIAAAGSPVGAADALEYVPVRYEDDMAGALAAADLAVCRAGASTCFELLAVGLPAVLVPSPHVTADQQTRNAERLRDMGAATVVADVELDGARLTREVDALLADPDRLAAMAVAARRGARRDAADAIAALAEAHARG